MEPDSKAPARVWRSHRGPKIYMSDREYASVKRRAAYAKLSINRYIRRASLTCDIGGDRVHGLAQRVDRVGHALNDMMHHINLGGELRHEKILWILLELERTLDMIPRTHWIRVYHTPKGAGRRKHRGWVRGSLDDLAEIRERSALVGLPQAAFVRSASLQGPLGRKVWTRVLKGLRRWRSNLEQLCSAPGITADLVFKSGRLSRRVIDINVELTSGRKYKDKSHLNSTY